MAEKKPTFLRNLKLDELSLVDRPANPLATVSIFKRDMSEDDVDKAPMKTEGGTKFPASDYAYVPDKTKPSTWKLRLTSEAGGDPDPGIVGAAAAALGPGYRGQKVQIPDADRAAVVNRVRAAWRAANPDKEDDAMPSGIKKFDTLVDEIVKYIDENDGAVSFDAIMRDRVSDEKIWPLTSSLSESIRSIIKDDDLDKPTKFEAIKVTVGQFIQAVNMLLPDSMPSVESAFTASGDAGSNPIGKGENTMADENKQVAELQTQVAELTKKLSEAQTQIAKAAEEAEEVIKVAGVDIKKSSVGDATFAVIKAQQEAIAKAEEETRIAKAKETVEKDYGNLPGDAVAKAKAVLAVEKMADADRNTLSAMLVAGNKAVGESMKAVGKSEGDTGNSDVTKAESALNVKANEIMKRDSVPFAKAYDTALTEHPELYQDYLTEKSAA